ncbi:MAG: ComEC/Rec2 family competence protein [Treponema sp.]|nr:ComEC/Rec2 family competence protein [Candidatus Treponema merdequi]
MVKEKTKEFFSKIFVLLKRINIVYLSSIFLSIFVYSKILPLPHDFLISVIPQKDIFKVSARIISNPVKSSEKFYSIKLKINQVESRNKIISSANGIVTALVSTKTVEAHYPKKLFSLNKNKKNISGFLIESGATIILTGNIIQSENNFPFLITEEILYCNFSDSFFEKIQKIRALCRLQFKRLMSGWGKAGGLMLALLSSSKEYLETSMQNAFKLSGLSHILALSGMHLSLVSTLFGFIENKSVLKTTGLIFKLIMVFTFVFFAGFSPSLLRALISLLIISVCKLLKLRPGNSIFVLSLTFLIHAAISPEDLVNLGFLLSYGALAGILFLSGFTNSIFIKIFPEKISRSLSASVSAVSFTAPVSISAFGFFSPSGIICTLFVSPLITIFLYSGICLMFLSFCSPLCLKFSTIFINGIYELIALIVKFFSIIPVIHFQ